MCCTIALKARITSRDRGGVYTLRFLAHPPAEHSGGWDAKEQLKLPGSPSAAHPQRCARESAIAESCVLYYLKTPGAEARCASGLQTTHGDRGGLQGHWTTDKI